VSDLIGITHRMIWKTEVTQTTRDGRTDGPTSSTGKVTKTFLKGQSDVTSEALYRLQARPMLLSLYRPQGN